MAMKVLVTGGTGFLGQFVIRRLIAAGDSVRVLVRPSSKRKPIDWGVAEPVSGDLCDPLSLNRAVEGVEAICHCAAHMNTAGAWSEFQEITVRGTERLLEAAREKKVSRFLHVSSLGVYGLNGSEIITEESPFDNGETNRGHYTRSKIESEKLVWKYSTESGLGVTVIRPGVLYGPGGRQVTARLCVPLGPRLRIAIGGRNQILPLVFVENTADAIHLALRNSEAVGRAYNLVDDAISQGEYLKLLKHYELVNALTILVSPAPFYPLVSAVEHCFRLIGLSPPVSRHQFKRALASIRYDTSRARVELGWRPRVGMAEGLKKIHVARRQQEAFASLSER
jgi:nucleoside-diphosphate-sugar epimerase